MELLNEYAYIKNFFELKYYNLRKIKILVEWRCMNL